MKQDKYLSEYGSVYICKCKYKHNNCMMYENGNCTALCECMFLDKNLKKRQCPFYKANPNIYPFVIWDSVKNCVVTFEKTFDDARISVRILSGNYYDNGIYDDRYIIKEWKGLLWKLKNEKRYIN